MGRVQPSVGHRKSVRLVRSFALPGLLPHVQHAHCHSQESLPIGAPLLALCPTHLRRIHLLRMAGFRPVSLQSKCSFLKSNVKVSDLSGRVLLSLSFRRSRRRPSACSRWSTETTCLPLSPEWANVPCWSGGSRASTSTRLSRCSSTSSCPSSLPSSWTPTKQSRYWHKLLISASLVCRPGALNVSKHSMNNEGQQLFSARVVYTKKWAAWLSARRRKPFVTNQFWCRISWPHWQLIRPSEEKKKRIISPGHVTSPVSAPNALWKSRGQLILTQLSFMQISSVMSSLK